MSAVGVAKRHSFVLLLQSPPRVRSGYWSQVDGSWRTLLSSNQLRRLNRNCRLFFEAADRRCLPAVGLVRLLPRTELTSYISDVVAQTTVFKTHLRRLDHQLSPFLPEIRAQQCKSPETKREFDKFSPRVLELDRPYVSYLDVNSRLYDEHALMGSVRSAVGPAFRIILSELKWLARQGLVARHATDEVIRDDVLPRFTRLPLMAWASWAVVFKQVVAVECFCCIEPLMKMWRELSSMPVREWRDPLAQLATRASAVRHSLEQARPDLEIQVAGL